MPEPAQIRKDIRVALVLGGGGSRAIASLGVIEVLTEHNIPIDLIVGTSGGAFVGALYADNADIKQAIEIMLNFKREDVISLSLLNIVEGARSLKGGIDPQKGVRFLEQTLRSHDFKKLKIPLVTVATDLISGKTVGLNSGNIALAVWTSCAIPGLFAPVEMYDMLLVDGGVTAPLPVEVAQKYNPKMIIAVNVSPPLKNAPINNMFELIFRSALASSYALNELNGKRADILIQPKPENNIFDTTSNKEIYLKGREAAEKMIDQIKAKYQETRGIKKIIEKILPKKFQPTSKN